MTFKVGKLIVRAGEVSWKSFREENDRFNTTYTNGEAASKGSRVTNSRSNAGRTMVNSMFRKDLSVATPSIAKTRLHSMGGSQHEPVSFHMANPNP